MSYSSDGRGLDVANAPEEKYKQYLPVRTVDGYVALLARLYEDKLGKGGPRSLG